MKRRLAIFGAFILAVVCLLLWLRTANDQKTAVPSRPEPTTNATPTELQETETESKASGSPTAPALVSGPSPPASAATHTNLGASPEMVEQIKEQWRTPIDFYGKVVDQKEQPVPGAGVSFGWTDLSPQGYSRAGTTSDAYGLFSLEGKSGKHLSVQVGKEGYYPSRTNLDSFFYVGENENFVPHADAPVVFRLKKKSEGTALVTLKQNYRIPRDGTPVGIDLTTGKTTTGGGGDLIVRCWTEDQGKPFGAKYDWHCQVTPSGGLVTTEEEFPFTAPEEGYAPGTEIQMRADRPHWKSDVDLKFFYRLADGRYGRMTFSMIAGGQHFCMVDSFLNPSGSRNLEPMEAKPPVPVLPPGVRAVIPEFK